MIYLPLFSVPFRVVYPDMNAQGGSVTAALASFCDGDEVVYKQDTDACETVTLGK